MNNERKKKRQRHRYLSYILIPQNGGRPLQGSLSYQKIRLMAIIAGLFLVVTLALTSICWIKLDELKSIDRLRAENQEKAANMKLIEKEIQELNKKQTSVTEKQNLVKKLMGIKEERPISTESSRGGVGGVEITLTGKSEQESLFQIQEIKNSLARQEKELSEMLAMVNHDPDYFRSLPNQWPVQGEVSSPFGWRKSPFRESTSSFHDGIDIASYSGCEVMAAGEGKVTFSGWQGAYGRSVTIDHGHGLVSRYSHNSALLAKAGETVHKGEVIARVGSTGHSTGPHLHFTIFQGNEAVDPMLYLP